MGKKKGKAQRRANAQTAEEAKKQEHEELQMTVAFMKAELKALTLCSTYGVSPPGWRHWE